MKIVVTKVDEEIILNLPEEWTYTVFFTNKLNTPEGVLWVMNKEATLFSLDQKILNFFNQINEIANNTISNVQIYNDKNELTFDSNKLMFVFNHIGFEYIDEKDSLMNKPGYGVILGFHFYNTYLFNKE